MCLLMAARCPAHASNRNVEYPAYDAPLLNEPISPAPAPAPTSSADNDATPKPAVATSPRRAPPHKAGHQKSYSVWIWQENGDCLWRIAEKVYGDRSKWRLIYRANKDILKDPNHIYPGQRLKIPALDSN